MKKQYFLFVAALLWIATVTLAAGDSPVKKTYAPIPGGKVRDLASGRGGCFASDMITVQGKQVRFMYREKPDFKADSGWRFFAGSESQEYTDNANNSGIYDVNTIANYDPEIVPFLDAPIGSAFEKSDGKHFVAVDFKPPN
jgi:hypothetical protein